MCTALLWMVIGGVPGECVGDDENGNGTSLSIVIVFDPFTITFRVFHHDNWRFQCI